MRRLCALNVCLALLTLPLFSSPPSSSGEDGDPTFTGGVSSGLPSSGDYNFIAVGDVDGDGNLDISFGGEDYGSANTRGLYVYLGNGSGGWTSASTGLPTSDSWGGIAFGDADGDGRIELYAGNEGWGSHSGSVKGVGVWEYSSGTWSSSGISSPYNSGYVNSIVVENFTKGPGLDIAITTSVGDKTGIKVFYSSGSSPINWTDNSDGLPTSGEYTGIDVGDLNNDGLPDIAAVSYSGSGLHIFTQKSSGGWTDRTSTLPSSVKSGNMLGVVIGDVNGDGNADIVVGTMDRGMRLLLGNGGGSTGTDFTWSLSSSAFPSNFGSSGRFGQISLGDVDGDGDLDLLAPRAGGGLYLFLGNGSMNPGNSFAWRLLSNVGLPTTGAYYGSAFLDFDGDGDLDVAGATWGSGVNVYRTQINTTPPPPPNTPPVADAGENITVVEGETAYLNGTGSRDKEDAPYGDINGTALLYDWNVTSKPPGSSVSDLSLQPNDTVARPHFTPDREGNYTLTLRVRDSAGYWSEEDEVTVIVLHRNIPPIPDAGPDFTVHVGEEAYLNGTRSYDPDGWIVAYNWTPLNSSINLLDDDTPTPHFTPPREGIYSFKLRVLDNSGAWSVGEDVVNVTALPVGRNLPPVADAGPDQECVVGETVFLNGSGSYDPDGEILSWWWNLTESPTTINLTAPNSSTPSFIPPLPGTYTFSLQVVDNNNSWSPKDFVSVYVREPHLNSPPVAVIIADTQSGEAPLQVHFRGDNSYDPDGEIAEYHWDFSDGTTSSEINPTHTFETPGNYTVTLTVKDDEGADNSTSVVVVVLHPPPPPNKPPTARITANTTEGYAPLRVLLTASSSDDPDGTIVRYTWYLDGRVVGDGVSVSLNLTTPGNHTVRLVVEDDKGERDEATLIIRVLEGEEETPPQPPGDENETGSAGGDGGGGERSYGVYIALLIIAIIAATVLFAFKGGYISVPGREEEAEMEEERRCPHCGGSMVYDEDFSRWRCEVCGRYS